MNAMKGMELPINMIIIIAIAMLILVVVGAYFSGAFGGTTSAISLENAMNQACSQLMSAYNCVPTKWDSVQVKYQEVGKASGTYSLKQLCDLKGIVDETACARVCGCPG